MRNLILIKYRNVIPKCLKTGKHRFMRFWINSKKLRRKKRKGYRKIYLCVYCGKIKNESGFIYYNKIIMSIFKETMYFKEAHYGK